MNYFLSDALQKKFNTYKTYSLCIIPIYFSGLSLRKASEQHLSPFIKRNHESIWNWISHYKSEKENYEFVVDYETLINVGNELV
jgi:hypothetical protein